MLGAVAVRQCQRRNRLEVLGGLGVPGDLLGWINVKIFLRSDVRCVGAAEARRQVERLAFASGLFHELDRAPRELAVPRVAVVRVEHDDSVRRLAGDLLPGRSLGLARFPQVIVPRRRVFECVARVEDLTDLQGLPAVLTEKLRQHERIFEESPGRSHVVDDPSRLRPLAAEQ